MSSRLELSTNLQERISAKRLIFTVTAGRSGTGLLTNLLAFVPGAVSLHEPQPRFSNIVQSVQRNPQLANQFWVEEKLPFIADQPEEIYIETSHVACKGFLEELLALGVVPDLILLKREPRSIASSYFQLNTVPTRTELGRIFLVGPEDRVVLPITDWQNLHDYQLCYWYALESERRMSHYGDKFTEAGAKVVRTSIPEFANVPGLVRLTKQLSLPPPRVSPGLDKAFKTKASDMDAYKYVVNRRQELESLNLDALEAEMREKSG